MLVSWATKYNFAWPKNYHIPKLAVQKWVRPEKNGVLDIEGILSDEVRGILKDLNLEEHLIPQTPKIEIEKISKPVSKNTRRKSPRVEPTKDEQPKRIRINSLKLKIFIWRRFLGCRGRLWKNFPKNYLAFRAYF